MNNTIKLAHNILECVQFQSNSSPYILHNVLYFSPATKAYLETFASSFSAKVNAHTSDFEAFGDIANTCKIFWHMLAYDPSFIPEKFPHYFTSVCLARKELALLYIANIDRLHIYAQVCENTKATPLELIKVVGAVEASEIVYAHTLAAASITEDVAVINPERLEAQRKSAPAFAL